MRVLALKMYKKGISPLIATVLLVSFVVVLSGVIMFWGRQYVTELMEKKGEVSAMKLECEGVEVNIISASGGSISVRNGPVRLSGFLLKYPGEPVCNINLPLMAYEDGNIILNMCPGGGDQVNVIPVLKPAGVGAPPIPCSTKNKLVKL